MNQAITPPPCRFVAIEILKRTAKRVCLLAAMLIGVTGLRAQTHITDVSGFDALNGSSAAFIIDNDIDASSLATIASFGGTLEAAIDPETHMPYRLSGLSHPLFETLTGTVCNLVLEDVGISHTGNTGAIACTASGAARIYNVGILGGSVGGTGYTGGLVGLLDGTARVINCYSFADIVGGTEKAGIVGYNNYASLYNDLKTMVMNCMFYGDIAEGGTIAPVYGGLEISNDYNNSNTKRLNNYNYFLYEASFSAGRHITNYNCALAAEERFLVRFEFYRHLLNSTREMAGWYVYGSIQADAHSKMLKWVLDPAVARYPVLKEQGKYPSVVNYDPDYTFDPVTSSRVSRTAVTEPYRGRHLGTLTVNIANAKSQGKQDWPAGATVNTTSLTLARTDMDEPNYNFNYDKVQLPYYNDVGTGNYTGNRVVTGWIVTAVTGGTQGERVAADFTTTTNYDAPYYNFADRDTYAKDLYSISGRIFAQGAYFNVPTGVTAITIEPYWAVCTYLSDAYYDSYGYMDGGTNDTYGLRYTNNNNYTINGSSQKVYTDVGNAVSNLTGVTSPTVYDYAVVLVGNHHRCGTSEPSDGNTPFTLMSIDNNRDNEPDYSFVFKSGKNQKCSPIRYDFINIPAASMAHKMASSTDLAIPGNAFYKEWMEVTTTALIRFGQLEYSNSNTSLSPMILMGGVVEQIVSSNDGDTNTDKRRYLLFGDNVWFKRFANGIHGDKTGSTPHRPISVTGGEYLRFYLTGYFRPDAAASTDNAECYIDGGRFGDVAGAGQENISGNVNWFVNHADIENFYGGGIKSSNTSQIAGNITTDIRNSRVTLFCGGPMFGDMVADKTVTTTADHCTFGTYFGAGYGGNSIYLNRVQNEYQHLNENWNNWMGNSYDNAGGGNYRGKYSGNGIAIGYEYEFFAGSSGNVARLYIHKVSFSLAKCNDVNSTLTGCKVLGNYYGGGSLGKVVGTATSELTSDTVLGNVFGAGFSVSLPDVEVLDNGGFSPAPNYNQATGVYEEGGFPSTRTFKWTQVNSISNGTQCLVVDGENRTIKTTEDLDNLGTVQGTVNLTIGGSSVIGTAGDAATGGVYGGGEESTVQGDTHVLLKGTTHVLGDVFGGGNRGPVNGNTEVRLCDECSL
ncbi:MAG: hypothetical protein IJ524_01885 [Bacteroidales bacterium]|nr:hypothetical protein [Bacteroidales bacterium]